MFKPQYKNTVDELTKWLHSGLEGLGFSNSNGESMLPAGAESQHTAILDTRSCEQGGLHREGRPQEFRKKPRNITKRKGEWRLKNTTEKLLPISGHVSISTAGGNGQGRKYDVEQVSKWLKFCSSFILTFKGLAV